MTVHVAEIFQMVHVTYTKSSQNFLDQIFKAKAHYNIMCFHCGNTDILVKMKIIVQMNCFSLHNFVKTANKLDCLCPYQRGVHIGSVPEVCYGI